MYPRVTAAPQAPDARDLTGRADGVVALIDLGRRRAGAIQFLRDPDVLWAQTAPVWASRSFNARRTTIAAGDFDDSGTTDMAVLADLAGGASRLVVLSSNGSVYKISQRWTSAPGALTWAGAGLATADLSGDGTDDLLVLHRLSDGSSVIDELHLRRRDAGSKTVADARAGHRRTGRQTHRRRRRR